MIKHADIMGMPVAVEVVDAWAKEKDIEDIFSYLRLIDKRFSTYKKDSEVEKINRRDISSSHYSLEMKKVLALARATKRETNGYFDVWFGNKFDPSGIVKGWAIWESAKKLKKKGYKNFSVEVAGDAQVFGLNGDKKRWRVGIQNPFHQKEIIKVICLQNRGIATSGNYIRGAHIYDPVSKKSADEIASMTVIAQNVYDADRFATAAFAMGKSGIVFVERLKNCEGYMVTKNKKGVMTSGFEKYVC